MYKRITYIHLFNYFQVFNISGLLEKLEGKTTLCEKAFLTYQRDSFCIVYRLYLPTDRRSQFDGILLVFHFTKPKRGRVSNMNTNYLFDWSLVFYAILTRFKPYYSAETIKHSNIPHIHPQQTSYKMELLDNM